MSGVAVLGWLLPGVPFAAALLGLALTLVSENAGRAARRVAIGLGVTGAAGALAAAVALLVRSTRPPRPPGPGSTSAGWRSPSAVRLDGAAALVAVAVAAVALAVQVYSSGVPAARAPHDDPTPTAATRRTRRRSASSPPRCCWWWSPVT